MKTSSCKAKGRRACQEVKELLHKYAPDLKPDDITITPSGCTGEDVFLSPAARQVYPLVIECKNTEALNIWKSFEQAVSHLGRFNQDYGYHVPILFFRRNRSKLMVCMEAEEFVRMIR